MAKESYPRSDARDMGREADAADSVNFRRQPGPLSPQAQQVYDPGGIGGTHRVSTPVDPEQALTGGYTPIEGDRMPPCPGTPYLPNN